MPTFTQKERREIDRIRKMPWSAQFHRTIENPTAPGGKVDMYILIDDDTGETIVGLSVPHGHGEVAEYIAQCCADPWFVRTRDVSDTEIASAFNRALEPFVHNGQLDGREVFLGAMTMIGAYTADIPRRSRQELIDSLMGELIKLRSAP